MFLQFISEIGGWWEFIKGLWSIAMILLALYMIPAIIRDHLQQEKEGHTRE